MANGNNFTYSQLRTEIQTDPKVLGYAALVTAGQTQGIALLLNSLTGAGTSSIFNNAISAVALVGAFAAADFASLSALQIAQLNLLMTGGFLDATNANTVTLITALISGMTAPTKTAVAAIAKRTGSRAESLWGVGTIVQASDVAAALGGAA